MVIMVVKTSVRVALVQPIRQTNKKTHTSQSALKEETKQTESEDKQLLIMLALLVILIVLLVLITEILSAYPID